MYKNIFYFYHINAIGGIETFFYNIAKKYNDYDIVIYYKTGDEEQIKRLKQFIRVKKYNGEKIKCNKAFFNFNLDIIDNVDAKEYIQILHGDYKAMGVKPAMNPKITKYLGVSKQVCKSFEEITGVKCELAYNPIVIDKPKKVLTLISATRLTGEKGKSRMIQLMHKLDNKKIPYIWYIFTDDGQAIVNPHIIYMKPRLDIIDFIAKADYLVQLSDNEGYCYSVAESLSVGTPVIVTDVPVFKEIGVKDGKNGFILDFDLSNINLDKIYKGLPAFEYEPINDSWDKIFAKGPSTYKQDQEIMVKVQCINDYDDIVLNKHITVNDAPYEVNKIRAEYLEENNVVKLI